VPRVVVVAARPAVRAGLATLLAEEGIEVVGHQPNLDALPGGALLSAGDLLLLDPDSVADVEEAAALAPTQPIVVLGPVADERRLVAALSGRAWGYLPRDASGERLAALVRAVANGLVAIDPELARQTIGLPAVVASEEPGEELTPREREVLQLIALGLPNKAIATRLAISEHTVKFHVASILSRLGATSRTDAVRIGARRGLVVL
jgi:DNA-binding NarL/FixJ family response regulator